MADSNGFDPTADRRRFGERSLLADEVAELERRLRAVRTELDEVSADRDAFRRRRSVRATVATADELARRWQDRPRLRRADPDFDHQHDPGPEPDMDPDRSDGDEVGTAAVSAPAWERPAPLLDPSLLDTSLLDSSRLDDVTGPEQVRWAPLVSIIMATYNRADLIGRAVASVLDQTYERWELIIVDDGSTDETLAVLAALVDDERVTIHPGDHGGASSARNRALTLASGELCAYLDSDNLWSPWFLEAMVFALTGTGCELAYADIEGYDDPTDWTAKPVIRRGRPWDWEACRRANFVDLNAVVHRRDLPGLWFDPDLVRNEDWDLILRLTRHRSVTHVPFVGCRYRAERRTDRLSVGRPSAYSRIVPLLHQAGKTPAPAFEDIDGERAAQRVPGVPVPDRIAGLDPDRLALTIDVVVSPPFEDRASWGDYHLARELLVELAALGHSGRIVYRDTVRRPGEQPDVNLVLRGDTRYEPRPGAINVLWVICDPEKVEPDELAGFDLVRVASTSWAALLHQVPGLAAEPLLQGSSLTALADGCSSRCPSRRADGIEDRGLFVGNSRLDHRPVVEWAAEIDPSLMVFGRQWEGTPVQPRVVGPRLDRCCVAELYRRARYVVNDHWPSMVDFGIISNRIFDVLAVGGRPISDSLVELEQVLPSVETVRSARELADILADPGPKPAEMNDDRDGDRTRDRKRARSSLPDRARAIDRAVKEHLGLTMPGPDPSAPSAATRTVLVVPDGYRNPADPVHHLVFSRVIAPLTATGLTLNLIEQTDHDESVAVHALVVRLETDGVRLATTDGREVAVPVSIDPRLWRHYRRTGVGPDAARRSAAVIDLDGLGLLGRTDRSTAVDHYRLARRLRARGPVERAVGAAEPGTDAHRYELLVATALGASVVVTPSGEPIAIADEADTDWWERWSARRVGRTLVADLDHHRGHRSAAAPVRGMHHVR